MGNEMHEVSCAFTGHRPAKLPWGSDENDPRAVELKKKLKDYIRLLVDQKGVRRFVSGMAPGIDMYAAEAVIELKKEKEGLILECAVPDEDFTGALSRTGFGAVCARRSRAASSARRASAYPPAV